MKVILHLGAHRTGTTSFQHYLRDAAPMLAAQGIACWGPARTRRGLFEGVLAGAAQPRRAAQAAGRVRMNRALAASRGTEVLVVSDENMIGTPRRNLTAGQLYPDIGERVARFHHAFGGQIGRVVLQIRSHDLYWASLLAYGLPRGLAFPDAASLNRLATRARGWRQVLSDLACALPEAELIVLPFERFAGRPDTVLRLMTPARPPLTGGDCWKNRSPRLAALREVMRLRGEDPALLGPGDGADRWQPFAAAQAAEMRERYADDLFWLHAGADGLARLIEEPDPDKAGTQPPPGLKTRGQEDDSQERAMALGR